MTASPQLEFAGPAESEREHWRSIVLFGRNVASYKFALAKALLDLADRDHELIPLEDLAVPFANQLCEHIARVDRQGTFARSRFLDACRFYNSGTITADELRDTATLIGFTNVIDAFHVVGSGEVYQKGHCFYCFRPISFTSPDPAAAVDVDHFFPHSLMARGLGVDVDMPWNLVLACATCNRGPAGKFAALPHQRYLDRLLLPARVQQIQATVEVDPSDDHRRVRSVAVLRPLPGTPRRVMPQVETCSQPL